MSERKYFCFCDSNCKFETMTKEQIIAAITQMMETGSVGNVDTGFVTTIKEQNAGTALTFWVGTTAQYNAIPEEERAKNCLYITTDDTTKEDFEKRVAEILEAVDTACKAANDATTAAEAAEKAANNAIGMKREFDSGSIAETEYTYAGKKSKFYTVLVHVELMSGGATILIDKTALTTAEQSFWGNLSADHFAVKAFLDASGYPHFSIDHSTYRLRRVCGYY